MATALPEAQDALAVLFAADGTVGPCWKGLGSPLKLETYLKAVWISGETDQWTQDHQISNLGQKEENFTIRIHCLQTVTGDFTAARDACITLSEQVETVIRANATTLTSQVKVISVGALAMEESRLDERRHQVLITLFVNCESWIG